MKKAHLIVLKKSDDADVIIFDEDHKKVLARGNNIKDILSQLGRWGRFEFEVREAFLGDFFCQMNV